MDKTNDNQSETFSQLLELYKKQQEELDKVKSSVEEVVNFNKALLTTGKPATNNEDDDSEAKIAKEKLKRFLEDK